jgi:hypothetical protein
MSRGVSDGVGPASAERIQSCRFGDLLADGLGKPVAYTSVWNGRDARGRRLANGVYFDALDNGVKRISRKLV